MGEWFLYIFNQQLHIHSENKHITEYEYWIDASSATWRSTVETERKEALPKACSTERTFASACSAKHASKLQMIEVNAEPFLQIKVQKCIKRIK